MGREAEPFAIDMAEMQHSDLLVEVMDPKGPIASGHLSAGDMYKVGPALTVLCMAGIRQVCIALIALNGAGLHTPMRA